MISSIHQPRSSIFAMFDDLILLSEGRMLYSGPADQALPYFEQLGHHCPQHYNPAEFLADIISVDASTPEAQQQTRQAFNLSQHVAAMARNRMTCMLEYATNDTNAITACVFVCLAVCKKNKKRQIMHCKQALCCLCMVMI